MGEVESVRELRRRAQWYRDFADVGSADNKELRLALARHFDRRADEVEAQQRTGEVK